MSNQLEFKLSKQQMDMLADSVDGAEIMHGELKNLMHEAELDLGECIENEKESGEAMDSMARAYAEGYMDALVLMYQMTYAIGFEKGENV
jgi:hypothetical protein